MNLREILLGEILSGVTKPSQYLGTEFNAVHKDPAKVDVRMALAFPDLYDLGLGNLGLHILYDIANRLPWCWAERAYAPAPDLEAALRARGLPLFALESKDALNVMDLIGFSFQSELTYTTVLMMLDLAGIPLRSHDRQSGEYPLIFAGGPAAVNPEPMAAFIDFFLIGDGEEAMVEIAEMARATKGQDRAKRLEAFAQLDGVYVPELHTPGKVVRRRVVTDLDTAAFPVNYIVPYAQLVHDRAGIEIMRGCTHGCRFCQAGVVARPIRTRSLKTLDTLLDGTLTSTGYEEASLLSLSTCDYPEVGALLAQSAQRAYPKRVALSVSSLRVDRFSVDLADGITGVRRSGLTFAPEAATPKLRTIINKNISDDDLFTVTDEAFRRGWEHVKYYFMIGLPGETDEDIEAIAELCKRALQRGRAISPRAKINLGVSTLVPKPFTPFQWAAQIGYTEILRRQGVLEKALAGNRAIKFGRHEADSSFVEGLIARGDRRTADLIEAAYRNGARLESSNEHLSLRAWQGALAETGIDADAAFCERRIEDPLPWDHIEVGVSRKWLETEWRRAQDQILTPDCRDEGCTGCGVRAAFGALCDVTLEASAASRTNAANGTTPNLPKIEALPEPLPVQRLRFHIGRMEEARFLSNHEWMSVWNRALRRADAPLSFSQGFHAHPKITFATAPPVGEESEADYMDVLLCETVAPDALLARLRETLPRGLYAYEVKEVPVNAASLMSSVMEVTYTIAARADLDRVRTCVNELMETTSLVVERPGRPTGSRRKRKASEIDLRPMIVSMDVRADESGVVILDYTTHLVDDRLAKPRELMAILGFDEASTRVIKRKTILGSVL